MHVTSKALAAHALGDLNQFQHARTEFAVKVLGSAAHYLRLRLRERQAQMLGPAEVARDLAQRITRLHAAPRVEGQHVYQSALFESVHAQGADWVIHTVRAGIHRLELSVPAQARLLRYRAKSAFAAKRHFLPFGRGRTRRLVSRLLPLVLILGATVACSLVSGEGSGNQRPGLVITPSLSKPKSADDGSRSPSRKAPWSYVLPVDHGVRADKSGQGHFRAPRFHGEHNGIDLLAPIGTPVYASCSGQAMAGVSRSFGRWVHVICPVPDAFMKAGKARPWASFFYAHLETTELPHNQWVDVSGAQTLGAVGKSGNAQGADIQPHLHLELIIQDNKRAAMDERHVGSDQSLVPAAGYFAEALSSECMTPYGFEPKSRQLSRARRIDPFVALTCLSQQKPNFEKPLAPLANWSHAWTQFYIAKDFNVNLGVEDSRLANK